MAIRITWTGKPLVAGEDDRSLTFDNLEIDWAAEGYDIWLRVTNPDDDVTEHQLSAVVGNTEAAKLSSVSGIFVQDGIYILKLILYTDGTTTDEQILSVDYYTYVYP